MTWHDWAQLAIAGAAMLVMVAALAGLWNPTFKD